MAPLFDYKAIQSTGKLKKGLIEAENAKTARLKLKKQGLLVTEIIEKSVKRSTQLNLPFFSGRVSLREVAMVIRQLASLIKANVPLVEALTALREQTEHENLKTTLEKVRQDVNEGLSLAKATASHPKVFDTISINMIEAGESSGNLGLVLLRLADLKEAQMRLRSKLISGMTYPLLMMLVSMGLMIAIFTFVIPKLTKVFDSMNKPIPVTTQFLMKVSELIVEGWIFILIFVIFLIEIFRRTLQTPRGRAYWDAWKLKFPIVGPLIRMIAVTRFSDTMGTLLKSGVPILTSMTIAKNLVDSVPIAKAISNAQENITEGQSIAEPLKKSGEFPPMMIHMIAIGEKTGELPDMLKNISETYEEQINAKIDTLTSLMEPIMIIGMGGAVGFIVMSVFMPLMDMMNINQR